MQTCTRETPEEYAKSVNLYLCRWCYTHQAEHGELPTDPMIDAHHDGNWRRLARLINARKLERRTRKRHR